MARSRNSTGTSLHSAELRRLPMGARSPRLSIASWNGMGFTNCIAVGLLDHFTRAAVSVVVRRNFKSRRQSEPVVVDVFFPPVATRVCRIREKLLCHLPSERMLGHEDGVALRQPRH